MQYLPKGESMEIRSYRVRRIIRFIGWLFASLGAADFLFAIFTWGKVSIIEILLNLLFK